MEVNAPELISRSKKRYIARIGNTLLARQVAEAPRDNASRDEVLKILAEFPDEMERCLKQASNVTHYSNEMKARVRGRWPAEMVGFFTRKTEDAIRVTPNFFGHMSFQAVWPRKNQEFTAWYSGEVVENFNILYDGSTFLAFGEAPSRVTRQYTWNFGEEAMKIIRATFEASKSWELTTVGPIMLHPSVHFLFVDPIPDTLLPAAKEVDRALYVFFPFESNENCEDEIRRFFRSVSRPVKQHYASELLREQLIIGRTRLTRLFETMGSTHQTLFGSSSWNPLHINRRRTYQRQLRADIRESYQLHVELIAGQSAIRERRLESQKELSQHEFLAPLATYFDELISDVENVELSPIIQGVRFFEDEARSMALQRATVEAAVLGAAIGVGVAAAVVAL